MTEPAPENPPTTWAITFTASGTVGQGTAQESEES
jgi:hypothetical protein